MVVASLNPGKFKELKELLGPLPLELVPLSSFSNIPEIEESGATFAENALIKARIIARFTGQPALADDSGLEVDFLQGRPGVFSSRYAGPDATDEQNNLKLLQELAGAPVEKRGAAFRCVLALASPHGGEAVVEGTLRGTIGFEMRGEGGFGYDPLFVTETGLTLAELPPEVKNKISHRARAATKLKDILPDFLAEVRGNPA